MVILVVTNVCESWTIKKAECQRFDSYELCCWSRLLRVSWIVRRSNQSILREGNHECSLEGLMLELKLKYFGHLKLVSPFIGNIPDAEKKIESIRRRGHQRTRWLDGITNAIDMNFGKFRRL